jgi:tRNA uridine 5-carbamoylmethylation protein Kti12
MGWGIWVTGLPSSGKSTITNLLVEKLEERGVIQERRERHLRRRGQQEEVEGFG